PPDLRNRSDQSRRNPHPPRRSAELVQCDPEVRPATRAVLADAALVRGFRVEGKTSLESRAQGQGLSIDVRRRPCVASDGVRYFCAGGSPNVCRNVPEEGRGLGDQRGNGNYHTWR